MNEKEIVKEFLKSKENRFKTLLNILEQNKIDYNVMPCNIECKNVFVKMTKEEPALLLVAHYDIVRNSTGINDNTTAVAMLIELIRQLKKENNYKPFNVLFTDKEESGMVGSYYFSKLHSNKISKTIVFDIIGYGDTLVYGSNQNFDFLKEMGIKELEEILPSDNLMFEHNNVKAALITAAHDSDLTLKENKYLLSAIPRFYESFHNRKEDNKLEIINFKLVSKLKEKVINYLKAQS